MILVVNSFLWIGIDECILPLELSIDFYIYMSSVIQKISHRDMKAANILLDESFGAVVGDFGLPKLLDKRDSHVTTAVRGTVGHIAPEYLSTGHSSEKTDVFGFGILLLELITGQKTLDAGNGQIQKGMILDWVRTLHRRTGLKC